MTENTEGATRARMALLAYDDDIEAGTIDLLTDLMHLCEAESIDFDQCLHLATIHFDAEIGEASP